MSEDSSLLTTPLAPPGTLCLSLLHCSFSCSLHSTVPYLMPVPISVLFFCFHWCPSAFPKSFFSISFFLISLGFFLNFKWQESTFRLTDNFFCSNCKHKRVKIDCLFADIVFWDPWLVSLSCLMFSFLQRLSPSLCRSCREVGEMSYWPRAHRATFWTKLSGCEPMDKGVILVTHSNM